MRPIHPDLIARLRRPDSTAQVMVEARVETSSDIRQRYDQWLLVDGYPVANTEVLEDGGVRLKASAANGPSNSSHPSSARTLLDSGPPAGPYIDPLSPKGLNGINLANATKARLASVIIWSGSESPEMELTQIQAWLNPQYDVALEKHVAKWRCDLYRLIAITGQHQWTLQPLGAREVDATGQGAGFVKFDYSFETALGSARPTPKDGPFFSYAQIGVSDTIGGPVTVALFSGYKADGTPADNIALGYDGTIPSSVSAAGSYLYGFGVNWDMSYNSPTRIYEYSTLGKVPAVKFIFGSHTAATVTFGSAGNRLTLSPAPSTAPEFIARGEVPAGTSITYEVSVNATVWVAYTDGQTATDLGIATQAFYYVRATLTPNSAGDRSPILRALGVAEVSITDLSDVAEVQQVQWGFDPLNHKSEIAELTLRAIHDGERDFRDRIHVLFSSYGIAKILLRVWIGDLTLPKSKWVHRDDFLIDEPNFEGPAATITCVSPLALLRGALPKFVPQSNAYPDGVTEINTDGPWTASSGSVLWSMLADNNGGVGLLPWDDSTYIESPTNPTNDAYTTSIQDISPPTTPIVGQVIIQYRYALTSGTSLTLAVALMEGATQRSSVSFTATSSTVISGSLTPTVTELAAISDWTNLRIRFTANGTGKIKVTWARLAILGTREDLSYSNESPATIASDLLSGQIALPGRYLGPGMEGLAGIGTGTTITLGKTIEAPSGGGTDPAIAKQELDSLAFVSGGVFGSSQGRVCYTQLYDVTIDTEGNVTYAARTGVPKVYIPKQEIQDLRCPPGYARRVPIYYVNWGFQDTEQNYRGTARGFNDAALAALGEARVISVQQADESVSKWVQTQGLANALSFRHVGSFGLGLVLWTFKTTYAYPELEPGDAISVEQDQFTAWNPVAETGILGPAWVTGIVAGCLDVWGREFAVWVPTYDNIGVGPGPDVLPPKFPRRAGNLILNGNFENGLANWSRNVFFLLESGADVITESASLKAAVPQGAAESIYQIDNGGEPLFVPVFPGDMLALAGTVKQGSNLAVASLRAVFYSDARVFTNPISTVDVISWSETTATTKQGSVAVPAGASYVNFQVVQDPPASPSAIYQAWFDDLSAQFGAVTAQMAANLVAPNISQTFHATPVFNVKDPPFNARGDGSTDDATAIQAAIDACNTAGGGVVYFPRGTYLHSTRLTVPVVLNYSIVLRGDGMRSSYLASTGNGIALLFGNATQDTSGTSTYVTQYCGMEDLSVNGASMTGTGNIGVQFTEMQKGWIRNCIIEGIPGSDGIGLYLLGSNTTGGAGAAAAPHVWRCRFDNVISVTSRRPLVIQNGDENDFTGCNFAVTTGITAGADTLFAVEIRQGHNNRWYGGLCSGDSTSLKTAYVGVYFRSPINASGSAAGDVTGNIFTGLVAEGFDRCLWHASSANTAGNGARDFNPSIYNTLFQDDGTQLGRGFFVQCPMFQAAASVTNYYSQPSPYCDALTFANGDTTPDVSGGNLFACANSSGTTITAFDNGHNGQRITILLDANTTIQNGTIKCPGAANLVGAANLLALFENIGGTWYCSAKTQD